VGVVGGGPAGSFFSLFLLRIAARMGLHLNVHIYEPRDFGTTGPKGCNMCGGIISESLVQNLAAEGILLPPTVVQRSLDSYQLHTDVGDVHIRTPKGERRIAAVHRGCGPRGMQEVTTRSFDAFLLEQALNEGARHFRSRVMAIGRRSGQVYVQTGDLQSHCYDLVAVATGINFPAVKFLDGVSADYSPPKNTKTYISEPCYLGRDEVKRYLGSSMHVFLLHLPRLEFAAIIPKGAYATICMLGENIDKSLVNSFLTAPEVRPCFPPQWQPSVDDCHCSPRISTRSAQKAYADQIVFVGDCGSTRLYKDGIGAAYRTAKAAASTALLHGIGAEHFKRHYQPVCDAITRDNNIGRLVFAATRVIQRNRFLRRGLLRIVGTEQKRGGGRMSRVLWNTFTGSAPYRAIFRDALHPAFLASFVWNIFAANTPTQTDIRAGRH
jgi:flavin-dependent dehydrogenase